MAAKQLPQGRVEHEAGRGGDDLVGSLGTEAGDALGSGRDTSGRAVALRRRRPARAPWRARRCHRSGAAPPRRSAALARRWASSVEMHPAAAAAAGEPRRARRRDPISAGVDDVDDVGPGPVALLVDDLGDDGLPGERSPDEHDPTVVVASQRLSPGGEPIGAELHGCHRRDGTTTSPARLPVLVPVAAADPDRPLRAAGRLLPSRRGDRRPRKGRRRPRAVGRHGRPVRPQPHVRAGRDRVRAGPRRPAVRSAPDGPHP